MPYIGKSPSVGGFHKLDNLTASATATYALTLGGGAFFPESANQLLVSLNGVIQAPQDSFTVSGSNIVFDSALTGSDSIDFIVSLGDVLNVGTPSDGSVTTAKLADQSVTMAKLATRHAFLARITTTHAVNAPVAGLYQFNISLRVDGATSNDYLNMGIRTPSYTGNGQGTGVSDIVYRSAYVLIGQPSTDFQSLTASTVLQCTANQEIQHSVRTFSDTSVNINDRGSSFSGALIG